MFSPDQFISDFEALSKLFSPPEAEEGAATSHHGRAARPEGGLPGKTPATIGPSDLLPVKVPAPRSTRAEAVKGGAKQAACLSPSSAAAEASSAAAAAAKAAAEEDAVFDRDDGRDVPSHTILYKQAVYASDAFLGMSGKDPSSACCEELVVRVSLPEARSASELDLDVRATRLRLSSKRYKLLLHLPRKVDADRGRANWDAAKHELAVSAPIINDDY